MFEKSEGNFVQIIAYMPDDKIQNLNVTSATRSLPAAGMNSLLNSLEKWKKIGEKEKEERAVLADVADLYKAMWAEHKEGLKKLSRRDRGHFHGPFHMENPIISHKGNNRMRTRELGLNARGFGLGNHMYKMYGNKYVYFVI